MRAIFIVHLDLWMFSAVLPPEFSRRSQRNLIFCGCFLIRSCHCSLSVFSVTSGPRQIQDRSRSRLSDPLHQYGYRSYKSSLGFEWIRHILQHHIVIMSITDIKLYFRFFHKPTQRPASMSDHCHLTVISILSETFCHHLWHIIKKSMAVAHKKEPQPCCMFVHSTTPVCQYG